MRSHYHHISRLVTTSCSDLFWNVTPDDNTSNIVPAHCCWWLVQVAINGLMLDVNWLLVVSWHTWTHQEVFDGDDDDDDDDEMIGQFSGTSDWWTVGTLLIIAVSLQPPHCQPFLKSIVTCHALVFACMTSRSCSVGTILWLLWRGFGQRMQSAIIVNLFLSISPFCGVCANMSFSIR